MKKRVTVSIDVDIEMPIDRAKACLESYQAIIERDGSVNSMFEHIAFNVAINGQEEFIEGIGVVSWIKKRESPVVVNLDRDSVEFEIDHEKCDCCPAVTGGEVCGGCEYL